ncbi:vegetative cell wall protein gp1-like [Triticum aestivum]|uniref:vegetative cell wall protein gp1-like n=1 Tax=Triticum aestivum TaxID=4565 RepID=UPI001D034DE0|nr:vegetative cell wall protein gp1-like [Triticum aestivum]
MSPSSPSTSSHLPAALPACTRPAPSQIWAQREPARLRPSTPQQSALRASSTLPPCHASLLATRGPRRHPRPGQASASSPSSSFLCFLSLPLRSHAISPCGLHSDPATGLVYAHTGWDPSDPGPCDPIPASSSLPCCSAALARESGAVAARSHGRLGPAREDLAPPPTYSLPSSKYARSHLHSVTFRRPRGPPPPALLPVAAPTLPRVPAAALHLRPPPRGPPGLHQARPGPDLGSKGARAPSPRSDPPRLPRQPRRPTVRARWPPADLAAAPSQASAPSPSSSFLRFLSLSLSYLTLSLPPASTGTRCRPRLRPHQPGSIGSGSPRPDPGLIGPVGPCCRPHRRFRRRLCPLPWPPRPCSRGARTRTPSRASASPGPAKRTLCPTLSTTELGHGPLCACFIAIMRICSTTLGLSTPFMDSIFFLAGFQAR